MAPCADLKIGLPFLSAQSGRLRLSFVKLLQELLKIVFNAD